MTTHPGFRKHVGRHLLCACVCACAFAPLFAFSDAQGGLRRCQGSAEEATCVLRSPARTSVSSALRVAPRPALEDERVWSRGGRRGLAGMCRRRAGRRVEGRRHGRGAPEAWRPITVLAQATQLSKFDNRDSRGQPTAPTEMAPGGSKAQLAADRQAEDISEHLSCLGSVAFERDLAGLVDQLRQQPNTMWTLSILMKDNTLNDLLSGVGKKEAPSNGSSSGSVRRLRATAKKVKHLNQPADLAFLFLHKLVPKVFTTATPWENFDALSCLRFALNVSLDSDLPHIYLEVEATVPSTTDAFKARYEQCGNRLDNLTKDDLVAGNFGYFAVEGQEILFLLSDNKLDFAFASTISRRPLVVGMHGLHRGWRSQDADAGGGQFHGQRCGVHVGDGSVDAH